VSARRTPPPPSQSTVNTQNQEKQRKQKQRPNQNRGERQRDGATPLVETSGIRHGLGNSVRILVIK
jgi:hypothetical protein